MRAQIALQISLNKLGLLVIPNAFALGLAHRAFDEPRRLKDGNVDLIVRGVWRSAGHDGQYSCPKAKSQ
jgi:hypothetical protein